MKHLKIEEFTDVITGGTPSTNKSEYWNGNIPWLNSGELNHGIITSSSNFISEKGLANSAAKMMPVDTVLIALTGATTGVSALLKIEACANQSVTGILPSKQHLPKYLLYYLRHTRRKIIDLSYGGAQKHISQGFVKKLDVPLPPLEMQEKVVDLLDQADSLRQKRKQAIDLFDEYLKSVFLEMFGDPILNPKGWEIKKLEELLKFMTSGSRGWAKYYSDEGSIFLTIKNVSRNGKLLMDDITYVNPPENAESKRTKVEDKDILLSITADLGRTAVVQNLPLAAYINQHLVILRLKSEFNPYFISGFLSSPGGQIQMQRLNKGAAKAGLNFNDIKSLQILIPPKNLQDKYEEIISSVENLKNKMGEQSNELDKHFNALMQKSFGIN